MSEQSEKDPVLLEWLKRSVLSQNSQYMAARHYRFLHALLGAPLVVLSAFVATSIVASYFSQIDPKIRFMTLVLSIANVVLAGLQTFLRFAERAENHKIYGARYGALRRKLEVALAHPPVDREELAEVLEKLRAQLDTLSNDAPDVPTTAWRSADRQFRRSFNKSNPITGQPLYDRNTSEEE